MQWLKSLVFIFQMYLVMAVMSLLYIPMSLISQEWTFRGIRNYCLWVRFSAHYLVGLKTEIRGMPPQDEVLVCSKHQSFFDILILCSLLPRPRFVMKKQLRNAPIVGYFARKIGCVVVDRGKKKLAINQLKQGVNTSRSEDSQLVIFPQGTRVAPNKKMPYKIGAYVIYEMLDKPCIPVATNVGCFWPRRAILRKPGVAVLEFLPPIEQGLSQRDFMQTIETVIEENTNNLIGETLS